MSSFKKGVIDMDPYEALGIASGATETEITKAYRKLALKFHPDKQKKDAGPKEAERMAKRFHEIKEARSLLLDSEHQEDRRAYDAKLASERLRKQADAKREQSMSIQRKRMRDELKHKEAMAKQQRQKHDKDSALIDQLRREGKQRREAHSERDAEQELEHELQQEKKARKDSLEDRQVRLKWDRKKISIIFGGSPSEHSVASLLSKQFGVVEQVELLGSKGNQALITFGDESSCLPCVDFYATSKELRAKFVGKRRERQEQDSHHQENEGSIKNNKQGSKREGESLEERRLRQAAEREALLRQMEEDDTFNNGTPSEKSKAATSKKRRTETMSSSRNNSTTLFPLVLPETKEFHKNWTPLQKLQAVEQTVLAELLSAEQVRMMQVSR